MDVCSRTAVLRAADPLLYAARASSGLEPSLDPAAQALWGTMLSAR
jgi:hypothetical protein